MGMLKDLMSAVWKERYFHRNGLVPIPKEAIYTAMIIGGDLFAKYYGNGNSQGSTD